MSVKKSAVVKASVVGLIISLIWAFISKWLSVLALSNEILRFMTSYLRWAEYLVFIGIGALYGAFAWGEGVSPEEGRYFRGALFVGIIVNLVILLFIYIQMHSSGIRDLFLSGPDPVTPAIETIATIAVIVGPLIGTIVSILATAIGGDLAAYLIRSRRKRDEVQTDAQ